MEAKPVISAFNPRLAREINDLLEGNSFHQVIEPLLSLIDCEPQNWHARFVLAVAYFRSSQTSAAQRALRYLCDACPDADLRRKADRALMCVNNSIDLKNSMPGSGTESQISLLDGEIRRLMGLDSPSVGQQPKRPKTWQWQKPV